MTDNDKNCGYPGCDGNHAHTPEEIAALPEVQAACDELVWETHERKRYKAWHRAGPPERTIHADEDTWLAKARQARDDAVKDAARLERELTTANERCAKAEAVLDIVIPFGNFLARPNGIDEDWLIEHPEAFVVCDAWQLTLPAEQKEADESEICNHCDKTSPPHDLGVCAGCGDHYCDEHLNAHCQSCLM